MAEIISRNIQITKQSFSKLSELLAAPNLDKDSSKLLEICKDRSLLANITRLNCQLRQTETELAGVRQIAADTAEDFELKELAITEVKELETKISWLIEQLNIMLFLKDPLDEKNIFLEITVDSDQDKEEASLWVGNLIRMYSLYTVSHNWQVFLWSEFLTEIGGFQKAILKIEGDFVYGKLKFETGIHQLETMLENKSGKTMPIKVAARVEAIPACPKPVKLNSSELKIYTHIDSVCFDKYTSVNKTPVGAKIIHKPTRIEASSTEKRSQEENCDRAMEILQAKLYYSKFAASKELKIIRTYNEHNNLIYDRRVSKSFPFAKTLEGNMEEITQFCALHDAQEKLQKLPNTSFV